MDGDVSLDIKGMAGSGRRDSIQSVDDDADQQQGLAGVAGMMLSQSFASGSMTELSSLYSMSEDVSQACIHCCKMFYLTLFFIIQHVAGTCTKNEGIQNTSSGNTVRMEGLQEKTGTAE